MSRAERDKWNEKYRGADDPPRTIGPPSPLVAGRRPSRPGAWALDLGAGLLRHSRPLAAAGFRVLALDVAAEGFRRAGPAGPGIHRVVGDLDEMELPVGTFELILAIHCLNREKAPAIARALGRGGLLLLEARRDGRKEGEPPSPFRLRPGEVQDMYSGLEVLHAEEDPELVRYCLRRP